MRLSNIVAVILTAFVSLVLTLPTGVSSGLVRKDSLVSRAPIDDAIRGLASTVAVIASDDQSGANKRAVFTTTMTVDFVTEYPGWNIVVSIDDGKWNVDLPESGNFPVVIQDGSALGTSQFRVWYQAQGQAGYFERTGDGGFINWAYNGCSTREGSLVNFC